MIAPPSPGGQKSTSASAATYAQRIVDTRPPQTSSRTSEDPVLQECSARADHNPPEDEQAKSSANFELLAVVHPAFALGQDTARAAQA